MNQEMLFATTLEQIKKTARSQGNCIQEEQVKEAFSALNLSQEQLDMVYDYLQKHHIGIGENLQDEEEFLTETEHNYLQIYLEELAALPEFSAGEKEAVTLSAMAGEADAKEQLIQIYLPYVVDVAKLYAGQGVWLEDLIGEGNIALTMGVQMLGCLEKPSEAQGMLGKMMMDAMEEYISQNASEGKKNKKVEANVNKVARLAHELATELGRKVTCEELAAEGEVSLKNIQDALRISAYKIEDLENGEQGE